MSLNDLKPANTKRARSTAMKAFERFLSGEGTSMDHVNALIFAEPDRASAILVTLMDKFGVHLAFDAGSRGQHLSRHSVAQYYRQVKCWLLEEFPVPAGAVARQLLSMGRTLEQHCIKRESGGFVKKAVACTKADLQKMTSYIYSTASCASDYQDAALLCLLWYMFGRASDLTFVRKQQLSIGAGGVFFIRFIRMKTSDEQALSLFPDADFRSCPLLALALALATQDAPSAALLSHLPAMASDVPVELTATIPLLELLDGCDDRASTCMPAQPNATKASSTIGIHALVNRLLDRVAKPAGVDEQLSSHSFRRGGAQHANACSDLSAQWIFDRGAWNMTTTNKAFAYVFNTPKEDHQVAKVLSGMSPKQTSSLPSLDAFDSTTQEQIREVSLKIFSASHSLGNRAFNVSAAVREVLTATLILHYPSLLKINAHGAAVAKIEHCAEASGVSTTSLLAWSQQLTKSSKKAHDEPDDLTGRGKGAKAAFDQQTALIERLIEVNRQLEARVNLLESANDNKHDRPSSQHGEQTSKRAREDEGDVPQKRRRRSKLQPLSATWFAWYAGDPRGWRTEDKHKKSDSKQLVAFMRLFIPDGYKLDESSRSYKDDVSELGKIATEELTAFLRSRDVPSTGSSAVLKALRQQHREGSLDDLIRSYRRRLACGGVADPAPIHHLDILQPRAP
jgi:integrase